MLLPVVVVVVVVVAAAVVVLVFVVGASKATGLYSLRLLLFPLQECSKCHTMDCFGTCFTHVQTCDYVRVQSATQWTASVHALHMSKPVITIVFKVLRNGLLRYMLYACPNL